MTQRKMVKVRVWTDNELVDHSDALLHETGEMIISKETLQEIRDMILIDEGKKILEELNKVNNHITVEWTLVHTEMEKEVVVQLVF